jgi:hypothetical protein
MLQCIFHVFRMYIAIISCGCCKSRSRCCTCCNSCVRMLQRFVFNVSLVFFMYVASMFYLDVAYVSHICCKCFIWILCMFCNGFQVFFWCFFASVSEACFKYFHLLFRRMLQVLHLDVSKINWVLHLFRRFSAASSRCFFLLQAPAGHPPCPYSSSRC